MSNIDEKVSKDLQEYRKQIEAELRKQFEVELAKEREEAFHNGKASEAPQIRKLSQAINVQNATLHAQERELQELKAKNASLSLVVKELGKCL